MKMLGSPKMSTNCPPNGVPVVPTASTVYLQFSITGDGQNVIRGATRNGGGMVWCVMDFVDRVCECRGDMVVVQSLWDCVKREECIRQRQRSKYMGCLEIFGDTELFPWAVTMCLPGSGEEKMLCLGVHSLYCVMTMLVVKVSAEMFRVVREVFERFHEYDEDMVRVLTEENYEWMRDGWMGGKEDCAVELKENPEPERDGWMGGKEDCAVGVKENPEPERDGWMRGKEDCAVELKENPEPECSAPGVDEGGDQVLLDTLKKCRVIAGISLASQVETHALESERTEMSQTAQTTMVDKVNRYKRDARRLQGECLEKDRQIRQYMEIVSKKADESLEKDKQLKEYMDMISLKDTQLKEYMDMISRKDSTLTVLMSMMVSRDKETQQFMKGLEDKYESLVQMVQKFHLVSTV